MSTTLHPRLFLLKISLKAFYLISLTVFFSWTNLIHWVVVFVWMKPIVCMYDMRLWGECSRWGRVIQGILAHFYTSFGENHGKHQMARSTSATKDWTRHLPFTSLSVLPLGHWRGLDALGCNDIVTNTGWRTGIVSLIELQIKRSLQWFAFCTSTSYRSSIYSKP